MCRLKSGEELAPDRLAGAALEEDVVGQHHSRAAVGVEDRHDVLDEVELLVARCRVEVLAFDLSVLTHLPAVGPNHCERRLAPEGRVRQDHGPTVARVGNQ